MERISYKVAVGEMGHFRSCCQSSTLSRKRVRNTHAVLSSKVKKGWRLSSWFLSATVASCDFAAQGNPTLQSGPPTLSNPSTDGSLSIMLPKFNIESKACTKYSRSALQQGQKRMALELLYICIHICKICMLVHKSCWCTVH